MTIDLAVIEAREKAALKTALHKPRVPFGTWILLKQDIPALIAEVQRYRELAKVVREMRTVKVDLHQEIEGKLIPVQLLNRAIELLKEVCDFQHANDD